MDLGNVMGELETPLKAIGLRVQQWGAKTVNPPAAVITLPESMAFHYQYGPDSAEIRDLMVIVLVGRAESRAALGNLMDYVRQYGPKSVKAALEDFAYTTLDSLTVNSVEFDAVTYGDVPYLGAVFHTHIVGRAGGE